MILLIHLLLGALIGQKITNPVLAIILAFLSHYFLDFIPHIEYSIKNITEKNWKKSLPDFIKTFADFLTGIALIFLLSKNQPIIYICAILTIIPDGLTVLGKIMPTKILEIHSVFHNKKIHYFKYKKIPNFWRVISQVAAAIIIIILFKN